MRIAVFVYMFPVLSESFVRREIVALKARGHEIAVFTGRDVMPPAGEPVAGVKVHGWSRQDFAKFAPSVCYALMSMHAHRVMVRFALEYGIPYAFRLWSGLDSFAHPSPEFYRDATADPLCRGAIVEDRFMADWATSRMGVRAELLTQVPNSINLQEFPYRQPAERGDPPIVLAVARFVPKKGLIHLVRASKLIKQRHETWIVGYGELEEELKAEAGNEVRFPGPVKYSELSDLYAKCTVYASPCVRLGNGDADGIPTTALEAMASGRPVVASDLLSAPEYINHGRTGYLVPAGKRHALAGQLSVLLADPQGSALIGHEAHVWAHANLNITRNIERIEKVLSGS